MTTMTKTGVSMTRPAMRPIDSIIVGVRIRKDMGDLARLAASIRRLGLLHPIVVDPAGRLQAGERRLEACKLLGWRDVRVTIVEADDGTDE